MQIVFLRDTTTSKGSLESITDELVEFTSSAVAQWGSDLRLGLITFDGFINGIDHDFVTVLHSLTTDHASVLSSMQNLDAGFGGGNPEASDEALRELLEGSECLEGAPFSTPFRAQCTKHAILVTDHLPGSCDDDFIVGVHDVNAQQRALDAAAASIKIQAVFSGSDGTALEIMQNYADVTGGKLYNAQTASGLAEKLVKRVIGFTCAGLEDCNDTDLLDECDIMAGTSLDCDESGRPDDCDLSGGTAPDCNNNGIPDACDDPDCDTNGIPDECELSAGTATDCNSNGIPDACEFDCDSNGTPDDCEPQFTVFVDASVVGGAGDGSTWEDAYPLLQDALTDIPPCQITQVWVADGTYQPDQGAGLTPGDRDATFSLANGVTLYGGFAGGESLLSERNVVDNPTILSGDVATGILDSRHVVTAAAGINGSAVLDGFTITGGRGDNATGSPSDGAGLVVEVDASPILRNCTFDGNLANNSGAARVLGPARFEDCTFVNNFSDGSGGAAGVFDTEAIFSSCVFADNLAGQVGGAIYVVGGGVQVVDSFLGSNGAGFDGGGLYATSGATGTVDRCTFVGNTAQFSGGALEIVTGSEFTIGNSFFGTNGALGQFGGGGGVAVFDGSHATIFNSVFSDNFADFGGGVDVFQASATVVNSTFSRNSADIPDGGGGLENSESEGTSVVNCIFRDNIANVQLNQIAQFQDGGVPTNLRVSHTNVQGGLAGIPSCGNCPIDYLASNIDADPLFVDPIGDDGRDGTPDDNLRLLPGSPSIDAGSNGAVAAILADFDGNARIFNTVDMGAFEDFLDCNSNSIADPGDLMDFNEDGVIDLLDFQAFQLCFGDTESACLAAFDRALDCGVIDLADYEVLFSQYTGPGAGMMMFMDGGGGEEEFGMMAGSQESSESAFEEPEAAPENPWTFEEAGLDFKIQPLGGGAPLTALEPHTAYELHYDAKVDGVTSSLLGSLAANAAEGLAGVEPASGGAWSDTGSFVFEAFSDEDPIPDPAGSDLYRTTWTRDEVVFPGESNPPAPSSGFLHIITTGDEGALTLELFMDYVDESGSTWVGMEARKTYQVEE